MSSLLHAVGGLWTTLAQSSQPLIRWDWIGRNIDLLWDLWSDHVVLTVFPVGFGFLLALPLSLVAVRWPSFYGPLLAATGVLFTIPSLAIFVLLMPFAGLSRTTAIVGLVIYTLLILVRNTVEGFRGVSPEVREAAQAMGYTRLRQLASVELPLALPAIIAGLRIATVSTIGLVTVTALIGQGGLGRLFVDGFVRNFPTMILTGFVLTLVFAVLADLILVGIQRFFMPWERGMAGR